MTAALLSIRTRLWCTVLVVLALVTAGAAAGAAAVTDHALLALCATLAAVLVLVTVALLTARLRQRAAEGAARMQQSADAAHQAADQATDLLAQMARMSRTLHDIDAGAHRMADIAGAIDGIAFQTHIVALNAAVEAARAGEPGRGFAVLASEMRSLAQRSADAVREIKGLVDAGIERADAGAGQLTAAGATAQAIVASVQRTGRSAGGKAH